MGKNRETAEPVSTPYLKMLKKKIH